MMRRQEFVQEYFRFTRLERVGLLVILTLTLILFFLPGVFRKQLQKHPVKGDTSWITSLKNLEINDSLREINRYAGKRKYAYPGSRDRIDRSTLFHFDPNTITDEQWRRLGLRDKTIKTIRRYIERGGRFRHPEDLQKIYGLFKDEYERLVPFVRINRNEIKNEQEIEEKRMEPLVAKPAYSIIEINSADTAAFIRLPGIGNKLANRIIQFREKLGGFYSVNQVAETYGLADSIFQKILPFLSAGNSAVRKININTATIDELKAHPYIRWNLATPIIAFRNEHGPFTTVKDIRKVMAVTDEVYEKLKHYLSVE
jgi:competence protein ComEA